MQIAPHIHRLGNGLVNSYLLEESGEVTIVDCGLPGYWRDLPRELAAMGRSLSDVRAVVLTHAHSDHIGFAERIRSERSVPVWIEELDATLARGEVPQQADPHSKRRIRLLPMLSVLAYGFPRGGLRIPPVQVVSTFGDGATLDVPGAPCSILVPGHTSGSAALHVPTLGALFVGDAFATKNVLTGVEGPQIAPFGADVHLAFESLSRLESLADAGLVLPGHGAPWTQGIAAAVAAVRVRGEQPAA